MYHISDLKKFNICSRLYMLEKEKPLAPVPAFIRLDQTVSDLAAKKLHIPAGKAFIGQAGDAVQKTHAALQTSEWLIKARFEADTLRIKVPFMHHVKDAWDIYFLRLSLYPAAMDMLDYQAIIWALEKNNIPIGEIRIIHLNEEYVRQGELDAEKLFVVSEHFYNVHHRPTVSIKEAIANARYNPLEIMRRMEETSAYPSAKRTAHCSGRTTCRFYESCFPQEAKAPDNSILTLTGAGDRYAMWKEGRTVLKDAAPERIEGTAQQYAEIMADRQQGRFVDRLALSSWLSQCRWPISFLDFEWERYALPPYDGMRPLGVLPFEYSLHIQKRGGMLTHTIFLSVHDDREKMIQSLLREIPKHGSIIAYNAVGAEMLRIQELAEQFPRYRADLLQLNRRMIDLQTPFLAGMVYDTRMAGHWTLKKITSLIQDDSYRNLTIHEGMGAVYQWRHLDRGDRQADIKAIVTDLKAYCSMDTYAMVMVLRWLQSLART